MLLLLLVFLASAGSLSADKGEATSSWWTRFQTKYRAKGLMDCIQDFDYTCARVKLFSNLNKMLQMRAFKLFDGVNMEKLHGKQSEDGARAWSDQALNAIQPRSLQDANERLDQLLLAGISKMLMSRAVKFRVNPGFTFSLSQSSMDGGIINAEFGLDESLQRGRGMSEGRGDKGKGGHHSGGGMMMMGMGAMGMMGLMGAKMMAAKAVLVALGALIIAVMQAFKHSHENGRSNSGQAEMASSKQSTASNRILHVDPTYSQDMAYRAQKP